MKSTKRDGSDPIISGGVGIRRSEWTEIDQIAEQFGMTRNGVAAHALRYFLEQMKTGKIQVETKVVLKLK